MPVILDNKNPSFPSVFRPAELVILHKEPKLSLSR
jgi:hypothetical protein